MKLCTLLLCFLSVSLCGPVPAEARKKKKQEHPMVGVWQRVASINKEEPLIVYVPFFKVLNADGTFYNLRLDEMQGKAFFAQEGSYSILSDSIYVEKIQESPYAAYKDIESSLKYHLPDEGKTFLLTEYWDLTVKRWVPELWMRVGKPLPARTK